MDTKQELLQETTFSKTASLELALSPIDSLRIPHEEFVLFKAGNSGYERPFMRDLQIAMTLLEDPVGLRDTLRFAALKQGVRNDPRTGEEEGKVFHEYDLLLNDGVELQGRLGRTTLYNACDTTALFLMGHEKYIDLTGDTSLFEAQKDNVIKATQYITRHLDANGLFVEDPAFSGADSFALRVTYWKDSHLKGRENGEPLYPVIYPLAHIQNIPGLRSGARLLNSDELASKADEMRMGLPYLFDDLYETLSIAIDRGGKISGISSDLLHALYYLEPGDIDADTLEKFLKTSRVLETPLGYRTLSPENSEEVEDTYHAKTVWTHEQAIIHAGAKKHRDWAENNGYYTLSKELERVGDISSRIVEFMHKNPDKNNELHLITSTGEIVPGGCDPQLWAIAAREYFMRKVS